MPTIRRKRGETPMDHSLIQSPPDQRAQRSRPGAWMRLTALIATIAALAVIGAILGQGVGAFETRDVQAYAIGATLIDAPTRPPAAPAAQPANVLSKPNTHILLTQSATQLPQLANRGATPIL